jgi:hypothetical protein
MSDFIKITEQESPYHGLENMKIGELLTHINAEDKTVAVCCGKSHSADQKAGRRGYG